jgi:7-cyano-7-deazaguanine reductase
MELHNDLKALAVSAKNNESMYDRAGVDVSFLEAFPNPFKVNNPSQGSGTVRIVAPEFTSLCPLTGFPDYAKIIVEYEPDELCLESKSWKLYLNSYRHHGEFHEACCNRMMNDLVLLLSPKWIRVVGEFMPRGGIEFWPTAYWKKSLA